MRGMPTMASPARTRSDQRFPEDLERFWNVRSGHCFQQPLHAQHEHTTESAGRNDRGSSSLPPDMK
jgi:hypothetical protein